MSIRASIIGITGYTGLELLRLLLVHPEIKIAHLTSRQHDNTAIGDLYPHLSHLDYHVTAKDHAQVAEESDVVFLALPHKAAHEAVPHMIGKTKIIDLSADFRLRDKDIYETTYGIKHSCPSLIENFVYGFPEMDRDSVESAENISNPGCFALLTQLMLLPFKDHIAHASVMAVTGSSGSGKTASDGTHHPIRNHNMRSYNMNAHRHIPEIAQNLDITPQHLNFIPTSGPFTRGIFATAFIQTEHDIDAKFFHHTPFIRNTKSVALADIVGSNFCDLSFTQGENRTIIAQGALDNLVKGAAGNAIQCMNLMFGLDETAGLLTLGPVYP